MSPLTLAREFCRVLNDWLDSEELAQIRARNLAEPNPQVCHSHDFCDANQAMLDAMQSLGVEFEPSFEQIRFTNEAWGIAKAVGFDPEKLDD